MDNQDFDKYMSKFESLVPELHGPWTEYQEEVFKEGEISVLDKHLIAVSCAHITGCEHCIEEHTKISKSMGATDEQLAECAYIAIRLAMGQPYAFSSIALENYDLMTAKKNVTEGSFMSKNITPQIMNLHELSGEMRTKFAEFHDTVYEDGHLPKKLKKGLMGLATAILAKCPWCIRSCIRDGLKEKVTKQEVVEAINIAMVMNGCAAASHAPATMKAAE